MKVARWMDMEETFAIVLVNDDQIKDCEKIIDLVREQDKDAYIQVEFGETDTLDDVRNYLDLPESGNR